MKIVYITRFFWPTLAGSAAAIVTLELAGRLANRGHEVSLFVPEGNEVSPIVPDGHVIVKQPPPAIAKGLVVFCSGPRLSRLPADTLSFVFLGFKAFRTVYEAHVIIGAHHHSHLGVLCAAILSAVTRKPLVIKVHDVFANRPSTNALTSGLDFVMKWLTYLSFKHADQVLVPSEELVDMVREVYGLKASKVGKLLNGVDTTRFSPSHRNNDLRRRIGSKHIVVYSGKISQAYYGLDVLVRATKLVRRNIPDLKVLIIGNGRDLPRLIQLANSLGLHDSIQFLGWVSPELIPMYLASADVGIGPLRASIGTIGATPLKVVEYMASGCVVVEGKGGASGDLIIDGANGIIAESADVADVAKSMLRAFSDEKLAARLRSKARETAEKVYDWELIVSELEDRLRSAIELRK